MDGFDQSLAFLIAIDRYENGVPSLKTPVADATALADVLQRLHAFDATVISNEQAGKVAIETFLEGLRGRIGPKDRVVFYFAGHGYAYSEGGDPQGFILPQDARKDAKATDSFISMKDLYSRLASLDCHHLLVVLDCCFAGAFRWSGGRHLAIGADQLHRERYKWFIEDRAWQAIASAAHDQEAIDVAARRPLGRRDTGADHSPFAQALIDGLAGAADRASLGGKGDGVITATELFQYVEDRMLNSVVEGRHRGQIPILWLLEKHNKGQFVFLVPGRSPDELPPGPSLDEQANPWRGLESYDEQHSAFFFGRRAASEALAKRLLGSAATEATVVVAPERFIVVTGPSGIGKSSLVKAGVLPILARSGFRSIVLRPSRPGPDAFSSLAAALSDNRDSGAPPPDARKLREDPSALAGWIAAAPDPIVLVVDQLEELVTGGGDEELPHAFLKTIENALAVEAKAFRVVFTVRPEYEPHFVQSALKDRWTGARFAVPQMLQDDLRRVIEGPAARQTMRFSSDELVDALVNDVASMPGALPLLSFALSQMYRNYLLRRRDGTDRTLTEEDYFSLLGEPAGASFNDGRRGGVTAALRIRANQIIDEGDAEYRMIARRVLERLVSIEQGEFARRRAPSWEFEVDDDLEQVQVSKLLQRLVNERLVVIDGDAQTAGSGADEPPAEPPRVRGSYELAHDALIHVWKELSDWIRGDAPRITDLRSLSAEAITWHGPRSGPLWDDRVQIAKIAALRSAPSPGLNKVELAFAKASQRRAIRNRAVVWVATLVLIVTTIGAVWSAVRALDNSVESQRRADVAESQRLAALGRAGLASDPRMSVLLAAHAVKRAGEAPERNLSPWVRDLWSWARPGEYSDRFVPEAEQVLREALSKQGGKTLCCHAGEIKQVEVSHDGHWIVTRDEQHVRLWNQTDPVPGRPAPIWLNSDDGAVLQLGFSRDDRWVVVVSENAISFWPPSSPASAPTRIAATTKLTNAELSASGRWLVTASGRTIALWDLSLDAPDAGRKILGAAETFRSVSFDGKEELVAIELDARFELWRIGGTPALVAIEPGDMEKEASYLDSIFLSHDGRWLAATIYNGGVYLWDLTSANRTPRFLPHPRPGKIRGQELYRVAAVGFSRDGKWLATASSDHSARLWQLRALDDAEPIILLAGYDDNDDEYTPTRTSLAISPDSRWLAVSLSEEAETYVWDLQSSRLSKDDAEELPGGRGVKMDQTGRWLAIASHGGIRLWSMPTLRPDADQATVLTGSVAEFSAGGAVLVTARDDTAFSWDLTAVGPLGPIASPEIVVNYGSGTYPNSIPALSQSLRWLVAADDRLVRLFDMASEAMNDVELDGGLRHPEGDLPEVMAAAFDPAERKLAIANALAIEVWELSDDGHRLAVRFPMPVSSASNSLPIMAISPDGRWLALAAEKHAWLWRLDPASRRDAPTMSSAHKEKIEYLAFSSDSRTLVTQARMFGGRGFWQPGQGMEIYLWSVGAHAPPSPLDIASADIWSFVPDPGGRWFFTAGPEASRLWDLQSEDPAAAGQELAVSFSEAQHALFPAGRGLLLTGPLSTVMDEENPSLKLWAIGRDATRMFELFGHLGRDEDSGMGRLSPDGRHLVTSAAKGELYLWDLDRISASFSPSRIEWSGNFAETVSFSADSRRFAVTDQRRLEIFDIATVEPTRMFSARSPAFIMHLDEIGNLLLTSDGKLWRLDVTSPETSAVTLAGFSLSADFTRSSRWLLDVGPGVTRWPLTSAQLVEIAKGVVGRNFTQQEWDGLYPGTPVEKTFEDLP